MSPRWLRDHLLGVAVVVIAFAIVMLMVRETSDERLLARQRVVEPYLRLHSFDPGDPLHRALLKESLALFYPDRPESSDSILKAIDDWRQEQFTNAALKSGAVAKGITWEKAGPLALMFMKFVLVYLVVLALSYYGAQTLGMLMYIRMKQGAAASLTRFMIAAKELVAPVPDRSRISSAAQALLALLQAAAGGVAMTVLFAPAYVIAYSFKTQFETDSIPFMIVLGVISNGLLITYANKFATFLLHEGRKGYVETAVVKNLNASFVWNTPDGVPLRAVFAFRKSFPGHVLHHASTNARYQYLPTVKEQAAFLITGLMIIEMALNIQGHLCYELLQTILFRDYTVALTIMMAIFLVVKATDIGVDAWHRTESRRYGNLGEHE
jgi:hypothetical protein